jgi:hypothetical protein
MNSAAPAIAGIIKVISATKIVIIADLEKCDPIW